MIEAHFGSSSGLSFAPRTAVVSPGALVSAMSDSVPKEGRGEKETLPKQGGVFGRALASIRVSSGIIVTGGCLRRPWAIAPQQGNDICAVKLSSNNYALGQFLYGRVNEGGSRALLKDEACVKFLRRVWKARNKAQSEACRELTAGEDAEQAAERGQRRRRRRVAETQPRPQDNQEVWAMLPATFDIEVESCATPGEILRFKALKGHPASCPFVVATSQSLAALYGELHQRAEQRSAPRASDSSAPAIGRSSSGGDPFGTPPRKRRRKVSPYGLSPGASASVLDTSTSGKEKRSVTAAVHLLKHSRRVVARYRDLDGNRQHKYFTVEDPDDEEEVQQVMHEARAFVREQHQKDRMLSEP